jgi:hypothetical protein
MKKTAMIAALAALSGSALAAVSGSASAADLGLSISVGQPGFFGQLDIGGVPLPPPPALIYTQPMVVERDVGYAGGPIYLHVPPGYERNWRRHCAQYSACGRPVYFVRDEWYQRDYVPHYQAAHRDEGRHEGERREERHDAQAERREEHREAQKDRREDHDRDHDRDH